MGEGKVEQKSEREPDLVKTAKQEAAEKECRNGESCKKKKCPFRHTRIQQEEQQDVPKTVPKAALPAVEEPEPVQEPLQLRDFHHLPPFHFFNKSMFPLELLKRFENKTSADRELTIRWTKAWLKSRGDRKGYPYNPHEPERYISIDYAFNKLSNEQ